LAKNEFDPDAQENFSPAERAGRDQLRIRISQYFCERIKANPAVLEIGSVASILGKWHEAERAKTLCKAYFKPHLFTLDLPPLQGKVIAAGHFFPGGSHTAIFAIYDDEPLLWLDDHTSNTEFDAFWQRENIRWENAYEAIRFMMITKFYYLPDPSRYTILNSVTDIPQERYRAFLMEENLNEELEKFERRLADVAPHIYPPSLTIDDTGIHLWFCLHLLIGGRVSSINCDFNSNRDLTCKSEVLGNGVGEIFMPK
jgi:hypothetical protein